MQNRKVLSMAVAILVLAMQSCTVTRVGLFFMPSTADYKVFPTDTLYAAEHSTPAFEEDLDYQLPALNTWIPEDILNGIEDWDELMDKSKTTSLLIVKDNKIICEKYANGHKKEDPQVVFSVSKAVTAMLVSIAIGEGKISPDQYVYEFIPEYADEARRNIKVYHLLNMVDGFNFADERDLAKLSVFYYNNNQEEYVRNFDDVKYLPGEQFAYKSMSTQVLSMCLEQATGKKLKDYLQEKLWTPLGMEYDALYTTDSKDRKNHRAFGGLAVRSRDLLRLGKLLLQDGMWEGKRILPAFFTEELKQRKINNGDRYWAYKNCFWLDGSINRSFKEDTDFIATGFKGQFIYVNPEHNIVIVRQGKKEGFLWRLMFGRLANELSGMSNDLTDPCLNYSEQFEGVYEAINGEEVEIVFKPRKGPKALERWIVHCDRNLSKKAKRVIEMKQFDGQSMGFRKLGYKSRILFDVQNERVVGMYYDDRRSVYLKYFKKKGEIPLQQRKTLLAEYGE